MRLRAIAEAAFPNGEPFYTDFPTAADQHSPIMTAEQAAQLTVAYHASAGPDLARDGIRTRASQGLLDLFAAGLDSTHQDSVYLAVSPEVLRHCVSERKAPYVYAVDLRRLDRGRFLGDEDAPGHCPISGDDWVASVMCMGTFRYVGDVPATAVRQVTPRS